MSGDGFAALDGMIARLRKFGAQGPELAAKLATPLVQAEAKRTAAAGTDPYGVPWRLRKSDGLRAMPEAESAVDVVVRGSMIVIRAHRGVAINNYISPERRRQVIPDPNRPLPPGIAKALQDGAAQAFRQLVAP